LFQPIDSTVGTPRVSVVTMLRPPPAQSAELQILPVPCFITTARCAVPRLNEQAVGCVDTTVKLNAGFCPGAKWIWFADRLSTIERSEQGAGVKPANPLAVGDGAELAARAGRPPGDLADVACVPDDPWVLAGATRSASERRHAAAARIARPTASTMQRRRQ